MKLAIVLAVAVASAPAAAAPPGPDDMAAFGAAMGRAMAAVKSAAPFRTLPPMFLGKTYHVVFDGHAACASGG